MEPNRPEPTKPVHLDLDDIDFEVLVREDVKRRSAQKLRRQNPYVGDIVRALLVHPKGVHRSWVISSMEAQRKAKGLPIPTKFEETVQSAYNHHSIDSSVFQRRRADETDGLFYAVGGNGSGYWAVFPARAKVWLAVHSEDGSVQ